MQIALGLPSRAAAQPQTTGEVLGFSVLPSTPEGTRRVPRSGKFARWALRRCYAGDVTVVKS